MDRTESDSLCRELSNGGLESVATLLVHLQIDYSCASPGKAIQLYQNYLKIGHSEIRFFTATKTCVQGVISKEIPPLKDRDKQSP